MTNRKIDGKEVRISNFDPANYLDSKETMAAYLQTALEENDPDFLMAALNDVIRAQGVAEVAGKAGLGRESLYKTLKPGAEPRLGTVLRLLGALDLRLSIAAPQGARKTKRSGTAKKSSGHSPATKKPTPRRAAITKRAAVNKPGTTRATKSQKQGNPICA
ncbi:addiction module antidote protein [Herbaspirillum huttiense]|uniref:addiction module antidote protein n=1 Tax=Herbaspirillum huttiense TaxID=863372 RepID=UPI0031D71C72